MRSHSFLATLAAFLLFFGGAARADPSCKDILAGSMAFGAYDPLSASPRDSSSTISFSCSNSLNPVISLSSGSGHGFSPRTLSGPGGDDLGYNLFTSALRNVVWGDGRNGTVALPVDARASPVTVYGRIFDRQSVRPGAYSDIIVVTFDF